MSPDDAPPTDGSPSNEPSSLSRRQLLGLVGGAGAVGGIGWFRPTWLPNPITDWLTTMYPDPPSNYVWQPPVSDEHADAAVANLESVVERAEELRSRVDRDSVDKDVRFHLRMSPAGGHLESAKDWGNARDRLRSATTGLQYAGETVGYATVVLGNDDPEFLVERGRELERAADELAASISEYRVSDPGRDLAYLYAIERLLSFTRLTVGWGDSNGSDEKADYSAHDFAREWGSQLQAQQRLRTARYHREQYRANLGDDTIPYGDRLTDAIESFWTRIDEYPRRSEMRTTIEEERDLDQSTPYGAARWELFTLCFDNDARYVGDYERGLTAKQFVDTARALLARRAHDFALDALDVDPGDTDYDSGRSFRAKRRAMREFRRARDEYGSPIAGVVASEAARRIRAGDVSLEMGDGPAWKERVESAVYYLVGAGMMRELGNVVEPVVNRDVT
ncbi:transcriptional initiation protein Tat [Haloferax sp. Atlit-12N]|uniref:transcriptional initiation protein Tat n=1 Tax=Haloferax sp. Atlit-12N TaxID=2077203 RepID=UPI000E2300A1|nr:transcriptional initiation protein Tat [Haloferax sp. Atlit-12N]RDZ63205.1 transcriptional initiation protein Tat [Haloferax sp. Atlit-12N]